MKYISLVVALMVAAVASAEEEGEVQERHLTGIIESGIDSQYIIPEGLVVHDRPIVWGELTLRYGDDQSGFYGGIWAAHALGYSSSKSANTDEATDSAPAENSEAEAADALILVLGDVADLYQQFQQLNEPEPAPPFESEIDFFFGWDHQFEHVALDVSLNWYDIGDLGEISDDQWGFDGRLTLTSLKFFQPYVQVHYLGDFAHNGPGEGWFGYVGASRHQPLGFCLFGNEEEQALDFGVDFAFGDGAMGSDPGFLYTRLWASSNIALTKHLALTPSLMWQIPDGSQDGYIEKDELAVNLSLSYSF